MITIGLTGSIGMGKSTVAGMFAKEGAHAWDADAAVHRLYAPGGAGAAAIALLAPAAAVDGVDRIKLRQAIMDDPTLLEKVEAAIHPLVAEDRAQFLSEAREQGAFLSVLDIPLIFETGAQKAFDAVVVVSAPADVQRERVLARPGMTEAAFAAILAKQVPDAEKRAGADFIVDTSGSLEESHNQVREIVTWAREQANA
ncbi:MAG: dephospho-CoA kinase [Pseudomonadota bacterium]